MGREIAGDPDKDVSARVGIAPCIELSAPCLEHLIRMEAGVFAEHRVRECGDQRLRRMAKREVSRNEPGREIDLSLAVEGVEQGNADHLNIGGQIVELLLAVLARDARRRHIEIASKVESHRSMQDGAHGCDVTVGKEGHRCKHAVANPDERV